MSSSDDITPLTRFSDNWVELKPAVSWGSPERPRELVHASRVRRIWQTGDVVLRTDVRANTIYVELEGECNWREVA